MAKKKADSKTSSKKKPRVNGAKKGKQFERDISNAIGHIFPEAERMLEYQASSVIGVDIQGTDRIKIQCKNHANYCSIGKIREIRQQHDSDIPVLVTKGIRMEPMAVLPFKDFVTLLEVVYGLRSQWDASIQDAILVEDQSDLIQIENRPKTIEVKQELSLNYFI